MYKSLTKTLEALSKVNFTSKEGATLKSDKINVSVQPEWAIVNDEARLVLSITITSNGKHVWWHRAMDERGNADILNWLCRYEHLDAFLPRMDKNEIIELFQNI